MKQEGNQMSTRAMYSFLGTKESGSQHHFNVYKHHDGYPSGAAETLKTTIDWFAWPLPRYESDAFAAAFCAAGKVGALSSNDTSDLIIWAKEYGPGGIYHQGNGGGVRLMPQGNPAKVAEKNCSDIEYRYEVSCKKETGRILFTTPYDTLQIKAFDRSGTVLFSGSF